jgi:predicted RNA-binding Zn-ribbon protein involved in translation (DUF1610 family)
MINDPENQTTQSKPNSLSGEDWEQRLVGPFGWASGYLTEWRCVSCRQPLTKNQVLYSEGMCPKCGHRKTNAGTIVAVEGVPYRLRRTGPWWMIWKRPERVYRSNVASDLSRTRSGSD